jgi:hypothetical protein
MDKQYFVNVINLGTGKIFSLPTLYTDRDEACISGQNYVRDRKVEDPCSDFFFRVLVAKEGQVLASYSLWEEEEEEEEEKPTCGNCDGDCQFCPTNYDVESEDAEDAEEPNWRDFCNDEEFLNYFINLMKKV